MFRKVKREIMMDVQNWECFQRTWFQARVIFVSSELTMTWTSLLSLSLKPLDSQRRFDQKFGQNYCPRIKTVFFPMTCVALCLNKLRSGGLSFFFFLEDEGRRWKKKPDRWLLFELTKNKLKESHRKRPVFKTNPSWNNKGTWTNLEFRKEIFLVNYHCFWPDRTSRTWVQLPERY